MDRERAIATTRALYRFWDFYNDSYLDGAMSRPVIRVVDTGAWLGQWRRDTRELRIAVAHVDAEPWLEVCGTLRHEMAHQYADEVLGAHDEPPHGPAFRRACERLRVVPGTRGGHDHDAEHVDTDRALRRVHKLFALGASPNEHEAAAAMRKARELVDAHELEDLGSGRRRSYGMRQLGPVKKRHARWENLLGAILGEFFHVEPIWAPGYDAETGREGSVLVVHGAERNLAMAEYVHGALAQLLEPLWRAHRAAHGIRGNRDRQRYQEGVLAGFRDKLRAADPLEPSARALIVRGDAELARWFRWHHPRTRTSRMGSSAGHEAYAAGRRDGREVRLARPLGGGDGAAVGGLLSD